MPRGGRSVAFDYGRVVPVSVALFRRRRRHCPRTDFKGLRGISIAVEVQRRDGAGSNALDCRRIADRVLGYATNRGRRGRNHRRLRR